MQPWRLRFLSGYILDFSLDSSSKIIMKMKAKLNIEKKFRLKPIPETNSCFPTSWK